ncbi:MAG: N-acetyltransferase [Promethearchaeota archaeon]|nr:MAG: N-acetyltransferase [Candidatus Lokiarchaeota archaeon]
MSERKEEEVFVFIEGDTIDLVVGHSKWADLTCKWMNDPKVRRYSRNIWPLTLDEVKKWFEPSSSDRSTREFVVLTIYHKREKKPIGTVGLNRINWLYRTANIFAAIGYPEYWGQGIAGEASELMIKYGFEELNLNKIYSKVHDPNKRSLRAAEKLGFKKEGISFQDVYIDGKYVDAHNFYLLKEDWMERKQL